MELALNVERVDPPRRFTVGRGDKVELSDCARVDLAADEQVTFVTDSGGEYDVVRKSWGFYATPSLNDRLPRHGFRAALVRDAAGKRFMLLVERGREEDFERYRGGQRHRSTQAWRTLRAEAMSRWTDSARTV